LEPHTATELNDASHRFVLHVDGACSPLAAFDRVIDLTREHEWYPDFIDGDWTTDPQHGVGSMRWFESKDLWLEERFVAWEPGVRLAFVGTRTTLPLVRRFAEEYLFVPRASGCRIEWTIHYTPRTLLLPLHPLLRPIFAKTFATAATNLQSVLTG